MRVWGYGVAVGFGNLHRYFFHWGFRGVRASETLASLTLTILPVTVCDPYYLIRNRGMILAPKGTAVPSSSSVSVSETMGDHRTQFFCRLLSVTLTILTRNRAMIFATNGRAVPSSTSVSVSETIGDPPATRSEIFGLF